jgi:hypothetical protein
MKADFFYAEIARISMLHPVERHQAFTILHKNTQRQYIPALEGLTAERAAQPGSDGRSLAIVVGHIAEWDRYFLLAVAEMLSGMAWPQFMDQKGYVTEDGQSCLYADIDEFNAFQSARLASWPWQRIQAIALQSSRALFAIFSHPGLLTYEVLQNTRTMTWKLPNGRKVSLGAGWFIWQTIMEHEGVEHAADLGFE